MQFRSISVAASAVLFIGFSAQGAVITQWNFNGDSVATVPGGPTSPTASTGSGTASLFGSATGDFASGRSNGGSTDPVLTNPPNYGWSTLTYGANTNAGNAGVQFLVNTTGYKDIVVTWDQRHSNTSSRYAQLQYTTDGGTSWTPVSPVYTGASGDTWFNNRTADLSSVLTVNDNTNFGFRITTANDPAGSTLVASNASSTYASTGTYRFDMVTVSGNEIPEPASLGIIASGALLARRRRI